MWLGHSEETIFRTPRQVCWRIDYHAYREKFRESPGRGRGNWRMLIHKRIMVPLPAA